MCLGGHGRVDVAGVGLANWLGKRGRGKEMSRGRFGLMDETCLYLLETCDVVHGAVAASASSGPTS